MFWSQVACSKTPTSSFKRRKLSRPQNSCQVSASKKLMQCILSYDSAIKHRLIKFHQTISYINLATNRTRVISTYWTFRSHARTTKIIIVRIMKIWNFQVTKIAIMMNHCRYTWAGWSCRVRWRIIRITMSLSGKMKQFQSCERQSRSPIVIKHRAKSLWCKSRWDGQRRGDRGLPR